MAQFTDRPMFIVDAGPGTGVWRSREDWERAVGLSWCPAHCHYGCGCPKHFQPIKESPMSGTTRPNDARDFEVEIKAFGLDKVRVVVIDKNSPRSLVSRSYLTRETLAFPGDGTPVPEDDAQFQARILRFAQEKLEDARDKDSRLDSFERGLLSLEWKLNQE